MTIGGEQLARLPWCISPNCSILLRFLNEKAIEPPQVTGELGAAKPQPKQERERERERETEQTEDTTFLFSFVPLFPSVPFLSLLPGKFLAQKTRGCACVSQRGKAATKEMKREYETNENNETNEMPFELSSLSLFSFVSYSLSLVRHMKILLGKQDFGDL
jgi:hypothetical protein